MSKKSHPRLRAKKLADKVLDGSHKTREDLEYAVGLTRSEAEAVYKYLVEAERRPEWVRGGDSYEYLSIPVVRRELQNIILGLDPDKALKHAEVVDSGFTFVTGQPVTFDFLRNTNSAPYLGATYQQDIEPAGRFMSVRGKWAADTPLPGWKHGTVTFRNPLVIEFNSVPGSASYDKHSWKQALRDHFGATGGKLSQEIKDAGYDGIVTVRDGETSEVVDLSYSESTRRTNPEPNYSSPSATAAALVGKLKF